MKSNYINIVFVVDESGSMYPSTEDVIGGFQKVIDEQKTTKDGKCTISLYTFADNVKEIYLGKDINEVDSLTNYSPNGMTAMNDGIGTAIDKVGKWLSDMNEDDRPSKTMVVIMTDGNENYSTEYTLQDVQDRIKHQTEKYSWEFVYIGTDITSKKDARTYGIKTMAFATRDNYSNWSNVINTATNCYRCCDELNYSADDALVTALNEEVSNWTISTEKELGKKISD